MCGCVYSAVEEMSSTPSKRKMNDTLADKENVADSAKKTKTAGVPVKPASRLAIPTRGRSALPRPGAVAVSKSTSSSLTASSVKPATTTVTTGATQEPLKEKESKTPIKRGASRSPLRTRSANTNDVTPLAERERKMAPIKDIVLDASQIAAKSVEAMKRIQRCMSSLKQNDKIRTTFETGITVTDEQVLSTINSKLGKKKSKSQNYHDYKDLSGKQLDVIKDLRAMFKSVFEQYKILKETCSSIEEKNGSNMAHTVMELEDLQQIVSILTQNDIRLRKDQEKLQDEISALTSAMKVIQSENDPLKTSMKDLEEKHWKVIEKLASEEALRMGTETENLRLNEEVKTMKSQLSDASATIKQEYEQRIEQSVAGYRDEVAALRSDLNMKQKEMEKINEDKSEHNQKSSELAIELKEVQVQLKESESNCLRLEKDNGKLTEDLSEVKNKLQEKEIDLRATMASMQQIQLHSNDQVSSLRNEITTTQSKLAVFESEKLNFVSELSTKNSEVSSLTKEVSQLTESNISMKSKLETLEVEYMTLKEAKMQLDVEREMRQRAEGREEAERTERVAACAQL